MKKHRMWTSFIAYFRKIPIDKSLINQIRSLLDDGDNVLIMIKKENHELNPKFTQAEKFQALGKIFPPEIQSSRLIISAVPDISSVINRRF